MADIFDVIADATRRDLLQALLDRSAQAESPLGELSVGEMVEKLGLSQPTVSKHLRVLRDADLVRVREEGQHRYYRLNPGPLDAVEGWVLPFLAADFDAPHEAGTAVFAAWAGARVPPSLRRAAQSLDHPSETGARIGIAAADAAFLARTALDDATATLQHRVIAPIRTALGR